MDYGFPQFTEAKILSEYIKTDAYKMEVGLPALPSPQKPVLAALSLLSVHQWEHVLINGHIQFRHALPAGTSTAADGSHQCCVMEV